MRRLARRPHPCASPLSPRVAAQGPAFNYMMGAAFEDGADYMYRINDDTKFEGAWAVQAVSALRRMDPPNVGVAGPVCAEGNDRILTHDFTHRTHMRIFDHYYPPIFTDWWMDESEPATRTRAAPRHRRRARGLTRRAPVRSWITKVYGRARTQKGPFRVRHMIGHQGTRYEVDFQHESSLATELREGGARIARFLDARSSGAATE